MVNLLSAFKVKPLPNGRPVPKETVNWRIIALALFGAGSAVLFGYDLGMSPLSWIDAMSSYHQASLAVSSPCRPSKPTST